MLIQNNGKKIITVLLALSCIVSGIILAASPSYKNYQIDTPQQLDSLLNIHFQNSLITPSQVRVSTISIDTIFTRKEYRVKVPSQFSKTLFHIDLHKDLNRYKINSPAKVLFPSRDMHIYINKEGTVLRTIHLTTDINLDTLMTEEKE